MRYLVEYSDGVVFEMVGSRDAGIWGCFGGGAEMLSSSLVFISLSAFAVPLIFQIPPPRS
jgi:hypothetical protein